MNRGTSNGARTRRSVQITIYRNPNCGCCDIYARYLEKNGFDVKLVDTLDAASIHAKYSVPEALEGCHTAVIQGHVFEGLIPAEYIKRIVNERSLSVGLATANLKGEVSLVNVFASWCVACREEHPRLMQISREGMVPVHGLNYKDAPADAARWLDQMGDPYRRTGADLDGRVAIDWGVYGAPETFVVDANGTIAYKRIGPITPDVWNNTMLPLIRSLQKQRKGSP